MSDQNIQTTEDQPEHVNYGGTGGPPPKKVMNNNTDNRRMVYIIIGILVFVGLAAGVYFFILNKGGGTLKPVSIEKTDGGLKLNTIENPLTGVLYSQKEAEAWKETRPLAVMVNNHTDARPQSGLIDADLVYEVVAEGGITRFLPFYLTSTPEKIGPVRSTREYYLVLVKELGDAMLMHIGWSPQALEAIETWPVRSLGRGGASFWRDDSRGVATEHTAYVNGVELRERGRELGWEGNRDFTVYKFKEDGTLLNDASLEDATDVAIDFWYEGDYSAIWAYDSSDNSYKRYMGYDAEGAPIPHVDNETNEQISVKNLIVQFAVESPIVGDDKSRLEYELIGSGSGLVFLDGKVVEVTWNKDGRDDRTMFYDTNGKEIEFNRGKFWISIVPDRNVEQVEYKASASPVTTE